MKRSARGRSASRLVPSGLVVALVGAVGAGCGGGSGKVGDRERAAAALALPSPIVGGAVTPRSGHTATLLGSGEVLVVGGLGVTGEPVAETDIVTATGVRPGPTLSTARFGHTATALPDGRVLIVGGASDAEGTLLRSTEVYDPVVGAFIPGPDLAEARAFHVAEVFDAGEGPRVLVAGGQGVEAALASAEVIDPDLDQVTPLLTGMTVARSDARVALLDGGLLLIVSGDAPAQAELFDPATRTFSAVGGVVARSGASLVGAGTEALVIGGEGAAGFEDSTDVFDAATRTFAQGPRLNLARRDATAALAGTDIVVVGGRGADGAVADVEVITGSPLGQATVKAGQPLLLPRVGHTVTAIDATTLLVIGGADDMGELIDAVEVIDLAAVPAPPVQTPIDGATFAPATPATPPSTTTPTDSPAAPSDQPSTPPASTPAGVDPAQLAALLQALQQQAAAPQGASPTTTPAPAAPAAAAPAASSGGINLTNLLGGLAGNLLGGLLGGNGSTNGSGLSGLLNGILGGGSSTATNNNTAGGLGGILGNLLGGLTGSNGGGGNFLGNLLGGLFGGNNATAASGSNNGNFLGNLLGGLFGGTGGTTANNTANNGGFLGNLLNGLIGGGNSGGGLGNLLGGLFGGSSTPAAASNNGGGLLGNLFGGSSSGGGGGGGGGLLSGIGNFFGGLFGDD